jgi:hypothetical protein
LAAAVDIAVSSRAHSLLRNELLSVLMLTLPILEDFRQQMLLVLGQR